MSKAIIYSESSHAVSVFGEILNDIGYDHIDPKEQVAFCGVDSAADLQLINAGASIEPAAKLAEKLASVTSAAVILLADAEQCRAREDALRAAGVIVVEKPLSRQLFVQAAKDALSLQHRIQRLGDQLTEVRRIARAKLILVEKQHMTEQQAHKYLEREAMNRRITRLELANELIESCAD